MKIDGINPTGKPGQEPKKTDKVSGDAFASFLKDAMNTGQATQSKPATGPAPVMYPQPVMGQAQNPFQAEALRQLDGTLSDLELYQNTLANVDVPSKRLAPLADSLMQKKDSLVALMGKTGDPKLKEMISQTAAVILNENSRLYSN